MDERTDLPLKDGTTIPPCSTSRTTVPEVTADGDLETVCDGMGIDAC